MPELIDRMKENLLRFNKGDQTVFDQEDQYLFEHIQSPEDFYDFLDRHCQIGSWDQRELFSFALCLTSETGSVGHSSEKALSDDYGKAVGNSLYRRDYHLGLD